jgi:hypothetical protein
MHKNISIQDKIFPSIDEIYYCVRKNMASKKELILYKLIIDLNEAIYNKMAEKKYINTANI